LVDCQNKNHKAYRQIVPSCNFDIKVVVQDGVEQRGKAQGHHHEIRKCSACAGPQSPERESCDPETQDKIFPKESKHTLIQKREHEWGYHEPEPQS
jgi:hypothetical protein